MMDTQNTIDIGEYRKAIVNGVTDNEEYGILSRYGKSQPKLSEEEEEEKAGINMKISHANSCQRDATIAFHRSEGTWNKRGST